MTLREIPNPNLSVFYSDEISIAKTIANKFFFRTSDIWIHTGMSLEVKK